MNIPNLFNFGRLFVGVMALLSGIASYIYVLHPMIVESESGTSLNIIGQTILVAVLLTIAILLVTSSIVFKVKEKLKDEF